MPPATKYRPEEYQRSNKHAKVSIGGAQRQMSYIPRNDSPGPASYGTELADHSKRTGHRRELSENATRNLSHIPQVKTPGPGTYNLQANQGKYDWVIQRQKALMFKEIRRSPGVRQQNLNSSAFV